MALHRKNTNRNPLYRLKNLKYGQAGYVWPQANSVLMWPVGWGWEATYRKLLLTLQAQLRPQGDDHFFACMLNIIFERDEPPLSPQSQKTFTRKQGKGGKLLGAPTPHADFLRETAEIYDIWQTWKTKLMLGNEKTFFCKQCIKGHRAKYIMSMLISVCHA